jgi:mannose-6-phosphate isomerase-like protein (cupin superfamily)
MTKVVRPWGTFKVIETQDSFQIKQLVVFPNSRLSMQSHQFRAEHWFVVAGIAKVEIDNQILNLNPGESVQIPVMSRHRVTAIGENPLIFIEIQTGSSFDENDIVRYEDDYGRS